MHGKSSRPAGTGEGTWNNAGYAFALASKVTTISTFGLLESSAEHPICAAAHGVSHFTLNLDLHWCLSRNALVGSRQGPSTFLGRLSA
jgi:hypothetical protein